MHREFCWRSGIFFHPDPTRFTDWTFFLISESTTHKCYGVEKMTMLFGVAVVIKWGELAIFSFLEMFTKKVRSYLKENCRNNCQRVWKRWRHKRDVCETVLEISELLTKINALLMLTMLPLLIADLSTNNLKCKLCYLLVNVQRILFYNVCSPTLSAPSINN